jgi:hypothetical protein
MHFGVPYKNSGALSKIGLEHHTYFVIWGVLTLVALCYNTVIAYRKYTKSRAYIPLLIVATIGMIMTLSFDFDFDKKVDYYLHCIGSLTFSVVVSVTIFVLFAICFNRNRMFKVLTVITTVILLIDLVCLFIYKETALIEALPIFAGYLMLGIVNVRRDSLETVGQVK